jgi:hypothetical protein
VRGTAVDFGRVAPDLAGKDQTRTLDTAIAMLLNGDVSSQTRAVLEKQMNEGVPVKGQLEFDRKADSKSMTDGSTMGDDGDALLADGSSAKRPVKGDKIAKYDYPKGREYRDERRGQTTTAPPSDQLATVFGLVLGSPEFQRR